MTYEIEHRLSVGAQYEYVNFRITAATMPDLMEQIDAVGDLDALSIGRMQAALAGAVGSGYKNPAVIQTATEVKAFVAEVNGESGSRAHVTDAAERIAAVSAGLNARLSDADKAGIESMLTDHRAPETLIQEELGGKVVAVQEQAAEAPSSPPWAVSLPAPAKPWKAVKADVAAIVQQTYPDGPPVESPADEFPDWD